MYKLLSHQVHDVHPASVDHSDHVAAQATPVVVQAAPVAAQAAPDMRQGPFAFLINPPQQNLHELFTQEAPYTNYELDLSECTNLGDHLDQLHAFLLRSPNITHLNVSHCSLSADQIDRIFHTISETHISSLKLDGNKLHETPLECSLPNLRSLSLNVMYRADNSDPVANGFNTRLESILQHTPTLESLQCRRLGLVDNFIRVELIPRFPDTLSTIDISGNFLYARGAQQLIEHPLLHNITMDDSMLTLQDIQTLVTKATEYPDRLRVLSIQRNRISPLELVRIRAILQRRLDQGNALEDYQNDLLNQSHREGNEIFQHEIDVFGENGGDDGIDTAPSWVDIEQIETIAQTNGQTIVTDAHQHINDLYDY